MSLEDRTEARDRLQLLAEWVPLDNEQALLVAGYMFGSAAVISGQYFGFDYPAALSIPMFGVALVLILFQTQVMGP